MTSLEKAQAVTHELADRILAFLLRQDVSFSISSLRPHFDSSQTMLRSAAEHLVKRQVVKATFASGIKHYAAKREGTRTPAPLTPSMTTTYKLPKQMVERGEMVAAERAKIRSIG